MAERKPKTTPAAPAGDESKQDPAVQGEQAPDSDPAAANALAVADPAPDAASQAKNEAERQDEPTPTVAAKAVPQLGDFNAIKVVAKCERFRRAGYLFGREALLIPRHELSDAQLDALLAEPMLVVGMGMLDLEGD